MMLKKYVAPPPPPPLRASGGLAPGRLRRRQRRVNLPHRGGGISDAVGRTLKGDLPGRFCPSPKVIAVILVFTNPFWPALLRLWILMGFEPFIADSLACLKTWRAALLYVESWHIS
jgi:hypothetical protein